uniref:nucleolar transcription factor 1 n=1 Tax=Panthera onca TaxID=9690 RepID=UPI0029556BB6|nr:nucleolar transcription factor 1 [Panthera onca]
MNGEADCPTDLEMAAPKGQDRWSQEDMLTLLECMKNNLPSNDSSKFKTTESHMDWEKVAFKDFSGDMCKLKWVEISNEVRKFRTLTELILDAQEHVKNPYKGKKLKKHPDFPKKPLTPYFRFFMEKRAKYAKLHPEMSNLDLTKILSKKYKELPEKKKMKYIQDFQREKQEFERNLARFREDHPDLIQNAKKSDIPEKPKTPQQLWYTHEKKVYLKVRPDATTKEVKDSLGKQWSQLSDKKRLKWIHKALEQRKEYEVRLPLRSSPSGSSRASALHLCDLRTLREAVTPCPSIEGGAFWAPHLCPYLPRPPPLHEISGGSGSRVELTAAPFVCLWPFLQKRKSMTKLRGPNPKSSRTALQSKSESEEDEDEDEDDEDEDEEEEEDENGDSSEDGGDSSESSSEDESEDGDENEEDDEDEDDDEDDDEDEDNESEGSSSSSSSSGDSSDSDSN